MFVQDNSSGLEPRLGRDWMLHQTEHGSRVTCILNWLRTLLSSPRTSVAVVKLYDREAGRPCLSHWYLPLLLLKGAHRWGGEGQERPRLKELRSAKRCCPLGHRTRHWWQHVPKTSNLRNHSRSSYSISVGDIDLRKSQGAWKTLLPRWRQPLSALPPFLAF